MDGFRLSSAQNFGFDFGFGFFRVRFPDGFDFEVSVGCSRSF